MLYVLLQCQPDPSCDQPSQCCSARLRMLWMHLTALPLPEVFAQLVLWRYLLFYIGFIKTFCLIKGKDEGRTAKRNYFRSSFYMHLVISFSGSDQYKKLWTDLIYMSSLTYISKAIL